MVTGTFTGIPFGGTTMVVLLTETERLIGGGEKVRTTTAANQGEEKSRAGNADS